MSYFFESFMTIFDELWLQLICTILIVIVIFSITSNVVFLDSSNELILVYEYKCLDKKMCEGIVKTPSNDINTEKNAHTLTDTLRANDTIKLYSCLTNSSYGFRRTNTLHTEHTYMTSPKFAKSKQLCVFWYKLNEYACNLKRVK